MSIKTISLRELFSSSTTKINPTILFSEALFRSTHNSQKKVVVSYLNCTKANTPHLISDDMREHRHEEADTLIPLHVIYSIRNSAFNKEIYDV